MSNIFFQPYFMLYGEVFAPDIDPECNPDCEEYGECGTTEVPSNNFPSRRPMGV